MRYIESLMSTGESVQHVARQHWIQLLLSSLRNGLVALLLLLFAGWAIDVGGGESGGGGMLARLALIALLWPTLALARDLARWYVRRYVVTTRRVIEIEGVLNRTVSDANLDKVNDIVLRQPLLGRMLKFGSIDIITGSDIGLSRLERIDAPVGFKRVMLDNKEDFDTLMRHRNAENVQPARVADADIPAAIARLGALRERGHIGEAEFEQKKSELLARM